jgi:hypothetical protein
MLEEHEIFLKVAMFNKEFSDIAHKMKNYENLWKDKFSQEFGDICFTDL